MPLPEQHKCNFYLGLGKFSAFDWLSQEAGEQDWESFVGNPICLNPRQMGWRVLG